MKEDVLREQAPLEKKADPEKKKRERARVELAEKAKQQTLEQQLQETREARKRAETQLKSALQGTEPSAHAAIGSMGATSMLRGQDS